MIRLASIALPFRLLRGRPLLLARFALASLGRSGLTAASILLIKEFLAGVLGEGTGLAAEVSARLGPGSALWVVAGLLLASYLGAAALMYDTRVTEQRLIKVVELGTMERLIEKLLGLSLGFYDRRTHGDLVQAVRQDVAQLRGAAIASANMFLEALQAASLIIAAFFLSVPLAVVAFVLLPVGVYPVILIARRTLTRSFGVRRKGVALLDDLLQLLRGIRVIKIYQGEHAEAERTVTRARSYFDELIGMERVRALAQVVLESAAGISLIAVIIVGGFQVMGGTLGWPSLLAFLMAARAAQGPLNNINTQFVDIQRYGASVERVDQLLNEPAEIVDPPEATSLGGPPTRITAEAVSFDIGGAPVLRGVSFDVDAGETLGIVGPSGAGKTTLLNLVARFYDPVEGCVRMNGRDLRTLPLRDIYRQMAIVTQDPFLFATCIRENIRCGRPAATDAEVEAAAQAAEIHQDILAMDAGYDTEVGHGARSLSRGEAQRVNIARAVLKNAPILLLDEATSSLDSHAEAQVQRAIDRLASGRLTISIAHRLSTLRNASRILVLERGHVVGLGTHPELLAGCEVYRRLWHAQSEIPGGPAPVR